MTASVNDLVSCRWWRRATSPTARSSVRDAERRFRPSASINDAVRSMPSGSTTPNPATSSGSDVPGANTPGPLSGSQACATEDGVACCYAVQDKVWVDGPDGQRWEVYTVLADTEVPEARVAPVGSVGPVEPGDAACCPACT